MPTHFKAAAMLAFGVASLLSAGQANASTCDGAVETNRLGTTRQCYYLPTVSDGRVTGVQKHVNYGGTPFGGYNHSYGRPTGAAMGGAWGHHGR
jgi:hypothetical protein